MITHDLTTTNEAFDYCLGQIACGDVLGVHQGDLELLVVTTPEAYADIVDHVYYLTWGYEEVLTPAEMDEV